MKGYAYSTLTRLPTMPFKHSCFISYARGNGILIKDFIRQLQEILDGYLDPYLDERVYLDEELTPGQRYEEKLASAICHSVCMIVVYTPTYARRSFCLREFRLMEELEEERLRVAGMAGKGHGLIIPIVLRGQREQLPERIARHIHYCDFSKFTTASPAISKDPDYVEEIEKIARYIYELWLGLRGADEDVCAGCDECMLPGEQAVQAWPLPSSAFPWRA